MNALPNDSRRPPLPPKPLRSLPREPAAVRSLTWRRASPTISCELSSCTRRISTSSVPAPSLASSSPPSRLGARFSSMPSPPPGVLRARRETPCLTEKPIPTSRFVCHEYPHVEKSQLIQNAVQAPRVLLGQRALHHRKLRPLWSCLP